MRGSLNANGRGDGNGRGLRKVWEGTSGSQVTRRRELNTLVLPILRLGVDRGKGTRQGDIMLTAFLRRAVIRCSQHPLCHQELTVTFAGWLAHTAPLYEAGPGLPIHPSEKLLDALWCNWQTYKVLVDSHHTPGNEGGEGC